MVDAKEFADLFEDKTTFAPARLWHFVLKKERSEYGHSKILPIRDLSCGSTFRILDFLRDHVGISEEVLDGSTVDMKFDSEQQKEVCIREGYAVGANAKAGSTSDTLRPIGRDRGKYASLSAQDIQFDLQNGMIEFTYNEWSFRLYIFTYRQPSDGDCKFYALAWDPANNDKETWRGQQLVADIYRWTTQIRDELWVFNGVTGGWRKDKKFYAAVQATREEDLILPQAIIDQLRRDTLTFFQSQPLFKELGVTWKRGILLLGPPGNGKTGMIKLLAKQLSDSQNIPALYVETPKTNSGPEYGITSIFHKARAEAPCLLILEDVETLVTGQTRTMMLNQLDGIEPNDGILIIATANDASKLDSAILQRPSRFDAKYYFDLPDFGLRSRFLRHWLETRLGISNVIFDDNFTSIDPLVEHMAQKTNGWTFAFLKELFLSVMLVQAATLSVSDVTESKRDPKRVKVSDLLKQVDVLQVQISQIIDEQEKSAKEVSKRSKGKSVHSGK